MCITTPYTPPLAQRIFDFLQVDPYCTAAEIAEALGVPTTSVSGALATLIERKDVKGCSGKNLGVRHRVYYTAKPHRTVFAPYGAARGIPLAPPKPAATVVKGMTITEARDTYLALRAIFEEATA